MDWKCDREVYVGDKNVVPGYLYDNNTQKFSPNKHDKYVETTDQISFSFNIWEKKFLNSLVNKPYYDDVAWVKDLHCEKAEDYFMIKGVKCLERRGIATPLDNVKCTVTSVYYRYYADMLVLLSQNAPQESLKELKTYLHSVIDESRESFLPEILVEHCGCAFVYSSSKAETNVYPSTKTGTKVNHIKHGLEEFCRTLKCSPLSTSPVNAFIKAPSLSYAKVAAAKLEDTTREVSFSTPAVSDRGTVRNKSTANTIKDNLPNVHSHVTQKQVGNQKKDANSSVEIDKVCGAMQTHCKCETEPVKTEVKVRYTSTDFKRTGIERCNVSNSCNGSGRNDVDDIHNRSESFIKERPIKNTEYEKGGSRVSDCIVFYSSQSSNNHVEGERKKNNSQIEISVSAEDTYKHTYNLRPKVNYDNPTVEENMQQCKCITADRITHSCQISNSENGSKSVNWGNVDGVKGNPDLLTSRSTTEHSKGLYDHGNSKMPCDKDSHSQSALLLDENRSKTQHFQNEIEITKGELTHKNSHGDKLSTHNALSQKFSQNVNSRQSGICNQNTNSEKCKETVNENSQTGSNQEHMQENDEKQNSRKEPESGPQNTNKKDSNRETETKVQNTSNKDGKQKQEIVLQSSQKNMQNPAKGNQKNTSASMTGASKKQNQKRLYQGFDIDDNDDHSLLKVTKQDTSHATKKKRSEKEKQMNMKSNLQEPVKTENDPCGFERKYYGIINDTNQEKVIILLGASGSGKTTLVNFIANYFKGNKTADAELIHVETTSQTSGITAYTFCSESDDIPITVIDTPGLNDSSGAEVRDHVQSLKTFLANTASKDFAIHAIGFVAQAHLVRLTSSERLVMDYISTMFGQSVSEHLITLVTFADNQDSPVVEAMQNYGVKCKLSLKFNNSTLSNSKSEEVDDLDRVYWRVCCRNWKKCLKTLRDLPPLSVNTMKAVQSEIYAATVIESAEKDLRAELKTFFAYCTKEPGLFKEALAVCEQIWELAAVVHRLKYVQNTSSNSIENIMVDFANETCKTLHISPDKYLNLLSLAPSRSLTVGGSEIIRSMAMIYQIRKNWHKDAKGTHVSKNITEWAYCHSCQKEHKMKRFQIGYKKYIPGISLGAELLAFKCEECKCSGDVHGVIEVESPFHPKRCLQDTRNLLQKTLKRHSFPGYAVQEERFLIHLNQHLYCEHQEFIQELLKSIKKIY